jgi:hypothetical protein
MKIYPLSLALLGCVAVNTHTMNTIDPLSKLLRAIILGELSETTDLSNVDKESLDMEILKKSFDAEILKESFRECGLSTFNDQGLKIADLSIEDQIIMTRLAEQYPCKNSCNYFYSKKDSESPAVIKNPIGSPKVHFSDFKINSHPRSYTLEHAVEISSHLNPFTPEDTTEELKTLVYNHEKTFMNDKSERAYGKFRNVSPKTRCQLTNPEGGYFCFTKMSLQEAEEILNKQDKKSE